MSSSIEVGDVAPEHVDAARRIIATAFAGEPFAFGMFGDDPIARLVGMVGEYVPWPWPTYPVNLAATVDGVLVGTASATSPGQCRCVLASDEPPPDESHLPQSEQIELEFRRRVAASHRTSGLPADGHISTVATEPFVVGTGVGRALVAAMVQRQWDLGGDCVVLECVSGRVRFYERCGFRVVTTFDDPGGHDLRTSLMRIDR